MRCFAALTVWVLLGGLLVEAKAADPPQVIDLWPGDAPGEVGKIEAEKFLPQPEGGIPVQRLTNITHPTLSIYRPAKEKDTGAAVVIAPGGGYHILAWDLEGEEVAHWLNSVGVTGILLKYRVPRREGTDPNSPPPQAQMDAQRAISLVRSKAGELGIDPARIGMLGFSAGGHLTAWTATHFDERAYPEADAVDKVSSRPDFVVLIYPGYLEKSNKASPVAQVNSQTPPTFLAHAGDDPVTCQSSVDMFQALKAAKVPAELHIYNSGGHGFGLRPSEHPASAWPKRCEEWLRDRGILSPAAAH